MSKHEITPEELELECQKELARKINEIAQQGRRYVDYRLESWPVDDEDRARGITIVHDRMREIEIDGKRLQLPNSAITLSSYSEQRRHHRPDRYVTVTLKEKNKKDPKIVFMAQQFLGTHYQIKSYKRGPWEEKVEAFVKANSPQSASIGH